MLEPSTKKSPAQLLGDPERRLRLKEALAGYRLMNDFAEEELRNKLPRMPKNMARKIFGEFYSVWEHTRKQYPNPEGDARLARLHIRELIAQRKLWDKIAQGMSQAKCLHFLKLYER